MDPDAPWQGSQEAAARKAVVADATSRRYDRSVSFALRLFRWIVC